MIQLSQASMYRERSRILRVSALGFFGFFLLQVASQALPPRILDPGWQITLISAIQQFALYPILGVLLLLVGASLDSSDKATETLLNRCRQPARWAAIGFLLMQPVVILAMLQMSLSVDRPLRSRIETLESVRSEMRRVTTLEQVNQSLARLPGAPSLPRGFNRPLEPFREQVLTQLGRDIKQLQVQRRQGLLSRRFIEVIAYLRQLATALLLTVVYGVIGGFRLSKISKWRSLFRPKSFRSQFSWQGDKRRIRKRRRKEAPAAAIPLPGLDGKKGVDHTGRRLDPYVQELMSDLRNNPDAADAPLQKGPEADP